MAQDQEKFSFHAEVVQLLDLMINSLYSNKEIFLRELISNASDAIDRLRIELLSSAEDPSADGPLQIRVSYDSDAKTITVADNGIGMSRAEVVENIGTIAKSGTREFLAALTGDKRKDATLIGQFGVGFYSSFIVAERVELTTRRAGLAAAEGVRWTSDGRGEYTLETTERPARGTTVVLHLRDAEQDLLNRQRLRSIITKYSDHISLPIVMPADGEAGDETVNQAAALWTRPKNEISDPDYAEFCRHISGDYADPLGWVHARIEGTYEFTLLLFIPSRAPCDLWLLGSLRGVRLHVRRIFILEDSGQLLPRYLRFVRGVIDSADLPLNVSRELLQGSRVVERIRSSATKKVLGLLKDMAEKEPDKYATFWAEFGAVLKEGIVEDFGNREQVARLARFASTATERPRGLSDARAPAGTGQVGVTLDDYLGRMKPGQEAIYYLLAPTQAAAASSPHLEAFRAKGVEALLLTDPVDHWVVGSLREFGGTKLVSAASADATQLGLLADETEKAAADQANAEFAALLAKLKEALGGTAHDVRLSSRLTTSPACIVAGGPEFDINLLRRAADPGLPSQPVLEINPNHPLAQRLNRHTDDPRLADWAHVLWGQAVLTLGARIENPADFVARLNDLLSALATDD
ncbi:MAG: molecular chaperone HtpG [Streptosporangiaceae bacterium]|nr:molecular chaperone HtpG [Streptosporangiaceae bacterium]